MKNFNQRWINILTQNQADKKGEFGELLAKSKADVFAIMEYRRMVRERGRGQHITVEHLKFGNRDENYLQEVLQELFLEPVLMEHIEYFYKNLSRRGYTETNKAMEELYRRHKEDTGLRFLSIAKSI